MCNLTEWRKLLKELRAIHPEPYLTNIAFMIWCKERADWNAEKTDKSSVSEKDHRLVELLPRVNEQLRVTNLNNRRSK